MELRSPNVEKIWKEVVICAIGEDLGIRKKVLRTYKNDIISMVSQINVRSDGYNYCCGCHIRKDGEQWTPYIQIIEMLLRLGKRVGCVKYSGPLKAETLVKFI